MCVCVYMSIHSLHIVVVIQLSYEWPHYFYSVTFHIWQLNSGKGKEHSVNDCPPPCDGWPHALPWQKSPASYCAAYSSTHRYTQKRTTDTRINLFKKKITPFFSLQRTLQSHKSSYSLRKEAWKDWESLLKCWIVITLLIHLCLYFE